MRARQVDRFKVLLLSTAAMMFLNPPVRAQEPSVAAHVRALNNQVLRLHGEIQRAGPVQAATLRAQATPVIEERARALSALIAQDAARALSLAFPANLLADLAAKFPGSAAQLESHGVWEGPIEYLIFDDAAMRTHRELRRMTSGPETLEIFFAGTEPAGLKSGHVLRVRGVRAGNTVAAAEGSIQGSTLAATSCSTTGVQKTAVLLVTFPGVAPPSGVTPQSVYDIFFATSGRSVDGYWREASYGQASAAGSVFGWYTLDASYTCDQFSQLRDAAIRAADRDVYFPDYNRLFMVFPTPAGCPWAGYALYGCGSLSSADGAFTASSAWLMAENLNRRDDGVMLATHEGGHNLGLRHARSRDFAAEALGPLGGAGTISEYGDRFNTMGSWNLGHYSAPQKLQLGWMPAGNYQTLENSGVFSVQPLEVNIAGTQALKVRRGAGNNAWVWLEYRQPVGAYDTALSSQVFTGATIHYEDSTTGSYTDLLDYTPETSSWTDPALAAGKTWTDPYSNLSLYTESASASAVSVRVNYGAVPCTEASPTVTISPLNPSVEAGKSVNYTVTVANNDSGGCSASAFSLSSTVPSGWPTAFSQTLLSISPGQTASTTMTKTVPAGTTAATYEVNAIASRGAYSASGVANCTVTAPPPPLSVSLSIPASTYAPRSTVSMTATVLTGSSPASGASVLFTMTKPSGAQTTKTALTDASGKAVWSYKLGPKDPKGTYSVIAMATYGSQTATSSPASFTVQ